MVRVAAQRPHTWVFPETIGSAKSSNEWACPGGDRFCCFRNILGRVEEEQRQIRHGTGQLQLTLLPSNWSSGTDDGVLRGRRQGCLDPSLRAYLSVLWPQMNSIFRYI
jgi:hypothetical protein